MGNTGLCNDCSGEFLPIIMHLKDMKKNSVRYEEDTTDGHPRYYGVIYHSKATLPVPPPPFYTIYVPILVAEL